MDMPEDDSLLENRTEHGPEPSQEEARPAWAITALASVLIFTTVVDVLGNLLVIVSVFRNRKLRNAGKKLKAIVMYDLALAWVNVCGNNRERQRGARTMELGLLYMWALRRNDIQRSAELYCYRQQIMTVQ